MTASRHLHCQRLGRDLVLLMVCVMQHNELRREARTCVVQVAVPRQLPCTCCPLTSPVDRRMLQTCPACISQSVTSIIYRRRSSQEVQSHLLMGWRWLTAQSVTDIDQCHDNHHNFTKVPNPRCTVLFGLWATTRTASLNVRQSAQSSQNSNNTVMHCELALCPPLL
jgi:hypothetical protein